MFWRKSETLPTTASLKVEKPQGEKRQGEKVGPGEFDRLLDTVGAMLRVFGECAFDTERATAAEVADACTELWRELSLGATKASETQLGGQRRDYARVRGYFDAQRRHEREFVVRAIENLRQAVQEFAQCLTVAVAEDRQADTDIELQVGRLVATTAGNDMNAIRQEAAKVAALVRSAVVRRRDREKEQLLHLGKQVQSLRTELDAVRTQAVLDALTQLFNRAAFDKEIEKVAALGLLLGSEPALVMVDVDHFKTINDRYGHPVGDEVLRHVADNLVRHFLRKEDFVCRFGGEEFAVVVRDSTLEKVAMRIDRARATLCNAPVSTAAGPIEVTFSAGATALVPGEPPGQWIERADRALYDAKHRGRNCVAVIPEMRAK